MRRTLTFVVGAFCLLVLGAANAGGPNESHPCYEVADCKTQASREEFSKCVKANVEAANEIAECAAFRKDKEAYMEQHGINGLDDLFN